jgi:hypothetical protein
MKPLDIDIEEIKDAMGMLIKFEENLPSIENIEDFSDAIEMLNNYLTDHPETSHKVFINNLKITYTRRVLQFLKSINSNEFTNWLRVVVALLEVKGETEKLLKSSSELKKDYVGFFAEWKDSPRLLSALSKEQKSLMPYMI